MRNFKKYQVWKKSHAMVLSIYRDTRGFPQEELYGLTSQIRRATISIAANIAEGAGKKTDADFARFLYISMGSASEVEYHILLAKDLGYVSNNRFCQLTNDIEEIKKMLTGFIQKLTGENQPWKANSTSQKTDR